MHITEITENIIELIKIYYREMFGNTADHLVITLHEIKHGKKITHNLRPLYFFRIKIVLIHSNPNKTAI